MANKSQPEITSSPEAQQQYPQQAQQQYPQQAQQQYPQQAQQQYPQQYPPQQNGNFRGPGGESYEDFLCGSFLLPPRRPWVLLEREHTDCFCLGPVEYPDNLNCTDLMERAQLEAKKCRERQDLMRQLNMCNQEVCDCQIKKMKQQNQLQIGAFRTVHCDKSCGGRVEAEEWKEEDEKIGGEDGCPESCSGVGGGTKNRNVGTNDHNDICPPCRDLLLAQHRKPNCDHCCYNKNNNGKKK